MIYQPDNWVVVKIVTKSNKTVYKVLAGWSGGYLDGDSWQLNSGIIKVEDGDGCYHFHGNSGSIYSCGKESYGLRANNAYVWEHLRKSKIVELMPEDTDWLNLSYEVN